MSTILETLHRTKGPVQNLIISKTPVTSKALLDHYVNINAFPVKL